MEERYYMKLPLKLNNENNIYYNCAKCYSYNYFMNIIVGGRGIGKTTTFLIKGVQGANKGNEFIYLRRYKPELQEFVSKDTLNNITDNVGYKGGKEGYTFFVGDQTLGYGITLSTAGKLKSVAFPKVNLIIFDEAVLPTGGMYRYLKDEMFALFEFISTVFRTRTDGKVVILGNNLDVFNPFFAYFGIPMFDDIYTDKKRGIYCELPKNSPKLLELEQKTGLYNLTQGTAYGDYHYDNKILTNVKPNVIKKPDGARLLVRSVMNDMTLNYYLFNDGNKRLCVYVEYRDRKINDNITYVLVDGQRPNYQYVNEFRKKFRAFFTRLYYDDRFYFSNERSASLYQWIKEKI